LNLLGLNNFLIIPDKRLDRKASCHLMSEFDKNLSKKDLKQHKVSNKDLILSKIWHKNARAKLFKRKFSKNKMISKVAMKVISEFDRVMD